MRMRYGEPSKGFQAAAGCVWLLVDVVLTGWLLFRYGMTGWADAYDDPVNAPAAPAEARRAAWILLGTAVTSGGLLLFRRYWVPGVLQLLLAGGAAGMFAFLAARG
ncbi:hypothetical protein [Streptomyces sp. NBC_00726]|uniref:hypothetical protein n=1 Tax=Streptomyces sp. NBC_00726 TaxID=2903674 RepID=UPI00386E0ECF